MTGYGTARVRWLVGAMCFAASAMRLLAQDEEGQYPIRGLLRAGPTLSSAAIRTSCPAFVLQGPTPGEADSAEPLFKSWCTVDSAYALPAADGSRWTAVVYTQHREHGADKYRRDALHVTRDTVQIVSAVLFASRAASGPWRAEWMGTVAQRLIYDIRPDLVARPDGSALVGVLYCINGTGGCWQKYLRRLGGRWTEVTEAFWKQLPPIPDGRIGKGMGVTLATLRGSYGVYSNDDANCCPSRELVLQLDQRGDSLVLRSHKVQKPLP